MINFVKEWFRKVYALFLWVCLVTITIIGVRTGFDIFGSEFLALFLGGGIGLLVGVITVIMVGGLIATFLSIDENIKRIADSVSGTNYTAESNDKTDESISAIIDDAKGAYHTIDESDYIAGDGTKIAQMTCPNCGKKHDIDCIKCPHCKHKY